MISGASGKLWDSAAGVDPAVPVPTTASPVRDGKVSGRHMIDGFRMMATVARTSGGKHQKEMADVYAAVALFIENEALRADRAEAVISDIAAGRNDAAELAREYVATLSEAPRP